MRSNAVIIDDDGHGMIDRDETDTYDANPHVMERGGVLYRLATDHLWSVRSVVDLSTGEIAQALEYDVFGKLESVSALGFQPFGYAGHYTTRRRVWCALAPGRRIHRWGVGQPRIPSASSAGMGISMRMWAGCDENGA